MQHIKLNQQLEDSFNLFWQTYPRRQKKKDCRKWWAKNKPNNDLVAEMIKSIEVFKLTREWKDGYIPMPITWLNGERWEDELMVEKEKTVSEKLDEFKKYDEEMRCSEQKQKNSLSKS